MPPIILHAPNVHQGGGGTLLAALLEDLPSDASGHVLLDSRMEAPALPFGMRVWRFAPTLRERLSAEWRLRQLADRDARVLSFGNLPPLFRLQGRVSVFVQNWNLIAPTELGGFSLATQWQHRLERAWLRRCRRHADQFLVQTETMRQQLQILLDDCCPVSVTPFVPRDLLACPPVPAMADPRPCHEFCYVSSAEPHKNHATLLEAWRLLAADGRFPTLAVTVSQTRFRDLSRHIAKLAAEEGLRIVNLGQVPHARIAEVYRRSRWLVYPSLCESFGLPLIEAQRHGLRILAPELDYVRDVVEPDVTFNPQSPRSLARAVQRALGVQNPRQPAVNGQKFLSQWMSDGAPAKAGEVKVLHSLPSMADQISGNTSSSR